MAGTEWCYNVSIRVSRNNRMSLKNASLDQVRINVKNDQTYTMTAALPLATLGQGVMQGYTDSPGDLGRATFTSNVTTAALFTISSNANCNFVDLIFANTAVSGTRDLFDSNSNSSTLFLRCVFQGSRTSGLSTLSTSTPVYAIECEAYNCNTSNSSGHGGFRSGASGGIFCYNCYSHDHTAGVNAHGFVAGPGDIMLIGCIADTCAGSGLLELNAGQGTVISIGCNYYNNTGDGIKLTTGPFAWSIIMNNNFIKNGGAGVNATIASQGGILYNNGRGAGSQANGSADTLQSIVNTSTDITYASGVTPWNAPTTGDFSTIIGSAAVAAGRGVFTETDGTNAGTISYPDIGAAAAKTVAAGFMIQ